MSSATQVGKDLTAEECRGFFEAGTQPLVDEFTAIVNCATPDELQKLYSRFLRQQLAELQHQEQVLQERVANIQEANTNPDYADNVMFMTRKAVALDSIVNNASELEDQIEYVQQQLQELSNITDESFKAIKGNAEVFLTTRTKILDNWHNNYQMDPLVVINDIDGETIAVTADGRDLSSWANGMLNRVVNTK